MNELAGHTHLLIYVDGACRFNPGPMGIGVAFYAKDKRLLATISEAIGQGTNNIAEYKALIRALKAARAAGATHLVVYTDSEIVAFQMQGRYEAKATYAQWKEASDLSKQFTFFRIIRIGRERNKVANDLAQAAIKQLPSQPKN